MDVMNKVITVSREFGSGGRELGVKLADALGIPFYDKELISMAADDINIAEEAFRRYDEHIVVEDPLDRNFYHAFSDIYQVPMSDQIFVAQSNVIRRLASHGPCIIVGRCADMVLGLASPLSSVCWQSGTSGSPMICGSWTMTMCTASCKVTGLSKCRK